MKNKNGFYSVECENMIIDLVKKAINENGTQNIELRYYEDEDIFVIYYCDLHEGYPLYKTNISMNDIQNIDKFIKKVEDLGIDYLKD